MTPDLDLTSQAVYSERNFKFLQSKIEARGIDIELDIAAFLNQAFGALDRENYYPYIETFSLFSASISRSKESRRLFSEFRECTRGIDSANGPLCMFYVLSSVSGSSLSSVHNHPTRVSHQIGRLPWLDALQNLAKGVIGQDEARARFEVDSREVASLFGGLKDLGTGGINEFVMKTHALLMNLEFFVSTRILSPQHEYSQAILPRNFGKFLGLNPMQSVYMPWALCLGEGTLRDFLIGGDIRFSDIQTLQQIESVWRLGGPRMTTILEEVCCTGVRACESVVTLAKNGVKVANIFQCLAAGKRAKNILPSLNLVCERSLGVNDPLSFLLNYLRGELLTEDMVKIDPLLELVDEILIRLKHLALPLEGKTLAVHMFCGELARVSSRSDTSVRALALDAMIELRDKNFPSQPFWTCEIYLLVFYHALIEREREYAESNPYAEPAANYELILRFAKVGAELGKIGPTRGTFVLGTLGALRYLYGAEVVVRDFKFVIGSIDKIPDMSLSSAETDIELSASSASVCYAGLAAIATKAREEVSRFKKSLISRGILVNCTEERDWLMARFDVCLDQLPSEGLGESALAILGRAVIHWRETFESKSRQAGYRAEGMSLAQIICLLVDDFLDTHNEKEVDGAINSYKETLIQIEMDNSSCFEGRDIDIARIKAIDSVSKREPDLFNGALREKFIKEGFPGSKTRVDKEAPEGTLLRDFFIGSSSGFQTR